MAYATIEVDELQAIAPGGATARTEIPTARGADVLILGLHLHLHLLHHVKGPAVDYVGVAVAAFLSWFGVPGPGEPVLIAASVVAAKHKLDLAPVVAAAFAGALAGGIIGWLVGLFAGRSLLTFRGPLRKMRLRAIARGEELFKRREVLAILLAPAWVAGIHRSGIVTYNLTNAASAFVWAGGIGLAAYYIGPPILDLVQDAGTVLTILGGLLLVAVILAEIRRRRRRREPRSASSVTD